MSSIPPPPPGFVLEQPNAKRQSVPPPPAGFVLDGSEPIQATSQPKALPADDSISELRTMTGGFLEGIPVVGPMIRGGVERAAAGTLAALSPDKDYAEVLQMIQQGTADEKKANPILDTASQVTGAVAGTVPMVMAAPAAFGASGGGLGARSGLSALSGAALGGADAAVRSQGDLMSTVWGGGMGLAGGAVAPLAGQAIGKGIGAVRQAFSNARAAKSAGVTPQAMTQAIKAMQRDGLDPQTITQRLKDMGNEAMLMDAGPNLQQQASRIVAQPGEGRGIIRNAISARDAGANARIRGAVDREFGPAVIPSQVEEGIRTGQTNLSPAYPQVFRDAHRVDTTGLAHQLESQAVNLRGDAQRAVQRVRQMLNVTGTDQLDPNPYTLFQTRQAIDDMMTDNVAPNAGRVLATARQEIDDLLARAAPGLKEVDAQFAELARQNAAVGRGQQVLDSGRTAPRPQELASEFQEGALPQGRQIGPSAVPFRLRQGARAEIDRIVGTNANDVTALNRIIKGEGDWNRSRLATLFGQDKADRIIKVLEAERTFADTSQRVTRNSATAERLAPGDDGRGFGLREGYMSGGILGTLRSAGVRGLEMAGGAFRQAANEADSASLAKLLSTKDRGQIVTALIKANGGKPVPQSEIDAAIRAFLIGGGASAVGAYRGR